MKTPVTAKPIGVALALALLMGSLRVLPATGEDGAATTPRSPNKTLDGLIRHRRPASQGTLGYGPPGLHPGFQGFGLGYLRGAGYGGEALGVGAEGGYPLYGGPGYPHRAPDLRRIGGIAPFCYYGGPGGPSPGHPNFFGGVGPLSPDTPIVTIPSDSPLAGDYGPYSGMLPYPESTFAPYATAAAGDSFEDGGPAPTPPQSPPRPQPPTPSPSPSPSPSTGEAVPGSPDARSLLGVDTDAIVDAGSARGIKVTRLQPGGVGDKAGLKVGDVIRSANGFLTERPGHLSWVVDNATPGGLIHLNVLSASDGEVRSITARRP